MGCPKEGVAVKEESVHRGTSDGPREGDKGDVAHSFQGVAGVRVASREAWQIYDTEERLLCTQGGPAR